MQTTEIAKAGVNRRGAGQIRFWRDDAPLTGLLPMADAAVGKALRRERALAGLPGYDPSRHLRLLRMERNRGEEPRLAFAAKRPS
jgi:hypothetical protein